MRFRGGASIRSQETPGSQHHNMWEFPKIGVPYFGALIIRILLFRVLS